MRLLKVLLLSLIIAIVLSFVLSLTNFIPEGLREPDVYYFSIIESMIWISLIIVPFSLISGFFCFLVYLVLEKINRLSKVVRIVLSIFIGTLVAILSIYLYYSITTTASNNIYLIPQGFEGEVFAFHSVHGAPLVEKEGKYNIITINEEGYFVTSSDLNDGFIHEYYYYVDQEGNRTSIEDDCVKYNANIGELIGYGKEGESIVSVNISYVGFHLTKDNCSSTHLLEEDDISYYEKRNAFAEKIFMDYYNIIY